MNHETRVAPACNLLRQRMRDQLLTEEKGENFPREKRRQQAIGESGEVMEAAIVVFTPPL